MDPFSDDDFVLENRTARKLYEGDAEAQPTVDYQPYFGQRHRRESAISRCV